MLKKTAFVIMSMLFTIMILSSCENHAIIKPIVRTQRLDTYIYDLTDYDDYRVYDSDLEDEESSKLYLNQKQKSALYDQINNFLDVEVIKYEVEDPTPYLRGYYVCLELKDEGYSLYICYFASVDGDYNITLYDSKTKCVYETPDDNDKELVLGVKICEAYKEILEILNEDDGILLNDVFPWLPYYVFNEIEVETYYSGMHPLTPDTHYYFKKGGNKDLLLDYLRASKIKKVDYNIHVPGESVSKVIFHLYSSQYELMFHNRYLSYNNNYYELISPEIETFTSDEIKYSFSFDYLEGEVKKAGLELGHISLDVQNIRFVPKVTKEYLGLPDYEIKTGKGLIYIYDDLRHISINNEIYSLTNNASLLGYHINKCLGTSLTYIENPYIINQTTFNKLAFEKFDTIFSNVNVFSLNCLMSYEGESLAKLLNLPTDISDEMIKSKYSLIEIARNDPIDDKFNNVKLHDLFVEGGNLYITTDYQVNSTEAFDAAIKTYYEYVIVHNDVIKGLKNDFRVERNIKCLDKEFNILPYHLVDDIKKAFYELIDAHGPHVGLIYPTIESAYGEFDGSVAVKCTDLYYLYPNEEFEETILGYTFTYPDGNRIYIYHNHKLYTLTEAFDQGFINEDNLSFIYNQSKIK